MNDDQRYEHLRERSWRAPLSAAEQSELQAWLAAHPRAQADWDAELGLSEGLRRLPDIPVPSNFTAGVLRAAQLQADAQLRQVEPVWRRWHWRVRWLPRIALAAVVLAAGVFSYHRALDVRRTEEWVRPLEVVSSVASLPDAEILRDFDAIRALDRTPAVNAGPDEDLLNDLRQ